jgi:polar amino acid transport system substrate-binding protein
MNVQNAKKWRALACALVLGLYGPARSADLPAKASSPASSASPVRIATGDFPPYADEASSSKGIAVSIVREAFALAGHKTEFTFLPWSRAQRDTLEGRFAASSHWGANEQRKRDFLLSDSILTEHWVFLHRVEDRFEWKNLSDLGQRRIGITRDYTYTPEFWAAVRNKTLVTDSVLNDLAGLRMLLAGRIDVLPLERSVACWLLSRNFEAGQAARVVAAAKPLSDDFETHLILPPNAPQSAALLRDFNTGLAKLKASKTYLELLRGVSCPKGLALQPATGGNTKPGKS